jgi:REP element-mobilizing transposase RayT
MRSRTRIILADHLVLMGYGHWPPNDLRGSGSDEIRNEILREFGEIHPGRKRVQPSREELRQFHAGVEPVLQHDVLWFDEIRRAAIAEAFARCAADLGYMIWACAILRNHAHLVIQRHKHRHDVIWRSLAEYSAQALRTMPGTDTHHPIWGNRPYSKFLYDPQGVLGRIQYVYDNPEKKGLPQQDWAFVRQYPC